MFYSSVINLDEISSLLSYNDENCEENECKDKNNDFLTKKRFDKNQYGNKNNYVTISIKAFIFKKFNKNILL